MLSIIVALYVELLLILLLVQPTEQENESETLPAAAFDLVAGGGSVADVA